MSSRRSERSRRPPTPSDAHDGPPAVSRAPPSVVGAGAGEAGHAPLVLDHLDPSVSSGNGTTQDAATAMTATTASTTSAAAAAKPTTPASTANRVTGRGKNWRSGIKGDIRFATRDKANEQTDVVYGTERPLPAKRRYPKTSSQGDATSPAPTKRKKGKKSAEVKNDPPREDDMQQQRAGTPVRQGTPPREPTPEKPKEPWEIEDPVWTEFSQEYYEGACRSSRVSGVGDRG